MRARSTKKLNPGDLLEISHYDDATLMYISRYVILEVLKEKNSSMLGDGRLIDVVVLDHKGRVSSFAIHEGELSGERWYGSRKVTIRSK
jgi:hypothetical protein